MQENLDSSDRIRNKIKEICLSLNYTILEDYKKYNIKLKLYCNLHDHIWYVYTNNFLNRHSKCPVCSGKYLDDNIIDLKLKNRNIKRIGNFTHSSIKLQWKCLKDNHIWEATTSSVLNSNNGCPKCSNNIRLTNEIIDKKIKNRQLKRIGNFKNNGKEKIEWQCKIDNHVWLSSVNNILKGNGCPKCANHVRITNDIIDERIKERSLVRIGSIDTLTVDDKIKWKCTTCNHEWMAKTTSIISRYDGCPNCKWFKTEKDLYKLIEKLNVECIRNKRLDIGDRRLFVDFYINNKIIIEYNGQQHYKPVRFGGCSEKTAKERFIKQQERDKILREYCLDNNIKLLEIPYYEKRDNWKNLILSTLKE